MCTKFVCDNLIDRKIISPFSIARKIFKNCRTLSLTSVSENRLSCIESSSSLAVFLISSFSWLLLAFTSVNTSPVSNVPAPKFKPLKPDRLELIRLPHASSKMVASLCVKYSLDHLQGPDATSWPLGCFRSRDG